MLTAIGLAGFAFTSLVELSHLLREKKQQKHQRNTVLQNNNTGGA